MRYNYLSEKNKIFTEQGQREFIKVRDRANQLLRYSRRIYDFLSCRKA